LLVFARKFWPHSLTAAIGVAICSYALFKWLVHLDGASSAANGLVLGIWGIAFSIVGFVITILQISKTQSATQAAMKAVNELRNKMMTFDSNIEIQKAIVFIRETQSHIKIPTWESANTAYKNSKVSILKLAELSPDLSESDRKTLASMLTDISTTSDNIDVGLLKGEVDVDRGRILKGCRKHEDYLVKLSIGLQRKIK